MKRYTVAVVIVLLVMPLCPSVGWSVPGQQRWQHQAPGGAFKAKVLMNAQRFRILGTNKVISENPVWLIDCVDRDGNPVWQVEYAGSQEAALLADMELDSKNNLIAAGWSINGTEVFWHIASYSSANGSVNWERDFKVGNASLISSTNSSLLVVTDVAIDSHDNIVVGGARMESGPQGYLLSLTSEGRERWHAGITKGTESYVSKVVIDSRDNVVAGVNVKGSRGYWYCFLKSFLSSGEPNWKEEVEGECIRDIFIDSHDRVVCVGDASTKGYVACLDDNGTTLWRSEMEDVSYCCVAVNSKGNAVVVGSENGTDGKEDLFVASYSVLGGVHWKQVYDSSVHGNDTALALAIDENDRVFVAGYTAGADGSEKWLLQCYSDSGEREWSSRADVAGAALDVAIAPITGDILVSGRVQNGTSAMLLDYEGYPQPSLPPWSHVLVPSETRTVDPAAETADYTKGLYLGFGDVVANGTNFKMEAAFPEYLSQNDHSSLPVKIVVAGVIPSIPNYLLFFDGDKGLKVLPGDPLTPWRREVSEAIQPTILIPNFSLEENPALHDALTGTNYWFTLVVPNTVADDLSDMDWDNTPWELTVNVFEVR